MAVDGNRTRDFSEISLPRAVSLRSPLGDLDLSKRDYSAVMPILVRSASLRHYDDVARELGLDPRAMMRKFGLPPNCLGELELRIPVAAVRSLLEATAERSGCESVGIRMAQRRHLSDVGPMGLLVRQQPNLRAALDALVRYNRQINEAILIVLEDCGPWVVVREEVVTGEPGPVRQATELLVAIVFRLLRSFLGPTWTPARVCFAHEPPRDRTLHDRFFARHVEFGHTFNGLVIAREELDTPNPDPDPGLALLAEAMLGTESRVQAPFTRTMREIIVLLLGQGACTVERAAAHLGVDRRTIHRRLEREEQSFSNLVDEVRLELAERYLVSSAHTLTEISGLLGFAAPSGFSRWYRQHTGQPPSRSRVTARSRAPT